ncbi:VOC family protein [Alkalihalobacillus sp. 1P02AB]|uniref:VOC family protein n=1 Tax=Alkalihalobacillus sp. 1P02AB TaxID=3132260 RepID=UPI0039A5C1CB
MSFQFTAIDHVQLAAPKDCEGAARKFFVELLGMEEIEKPVELKKNGGIWVTAGNVQLHIGVESDFKPAKKAHPALCVSSLSALQKHLELHHIPFQNDDKIPGVARCFIYDPFGNRIELIDEKK